MKFSRTPCRIEKTSPDLSAQTEKILRSYLGMTPGEIEDLRRQKIV